MTLWQKIKKDLYHPIPAFIFFFAMFNLMNMTGGLMLKHAGVSNFSFFAVLIASVIVAKVFIVIDKLPFTNMFAEKPLIYQTLWKTFLYGLMTLFIRFADCYYPFLWSTKNIQEGSMLFFVEVDWPRFWAIQIWFVVLFFMFVAARELVMVIGPSKVRKIFLGK